MKDENFLVDVISRICNYAVKNGYEADETLKIISENILTLLEISTFNNWKEGGDLN